jgi:uncharacterized membrane protein YedE/YeeE
VDLAGLIEQYGILVVLSAGAAAMGVVFGFAAQRSRFCARAAVIETAEGRLGERFCVWFLAFASALVAVQALALAGGLDRAATRFIGQPGSLSGAIVGGLLFGAGMILTRGCASRLLILSANGNLRALLSGLVFAVTVQATIAGWLSPLRQSIAAWWPVDPGPARDLIALSGNAPWGGMAASLVILLLAVGVCLRGALRSRWTALGGVVTGLMIAAGWAFTQAAARSSFDPVVVTSLSFSGPSAEWLMRVLSSANAPVFGFDAALLPAVFGGSLLAALVFGEFKFEGFKTENRLGHYLLGAVLMGFGAVLAGGCTVGAGMTGGALFALTAWLTLISIWVGATLAFRGSRALGLAT